MSKSSSVGNNSDLNMYLLSVVLSFFSFIFLFISLSIVVSSLGCRLLAACVSWGLYVMYICGDRFTSRMTVLILVTLVTKMFCRWLCIRLFTWSSGGRSRGR